MNTFNQGDERSVYQNHNTLVKPSKENAKGPPKEIQKPTAIWDLEKGALLCCFWEFGLVQSSWKTECQGLKRLTLRLPYS